MEKAIVQNIRSMLPAMLKMSKGQRSMAVDFDEEADVLYISFAKPKAASDTKVIGEDILVRKQGKKVVGITVLNASSHA